MPPSTKRRSQRIASGAAASSSGPSPGHSQLEQLPQEVLLDVLDHVQQENPESVVSAALASRTMHVRIEASGKLKEARLVHRAENAYRNWDTTHTVFEEVVAAAKDQAVPLTSEQRLRVIISLPKTPVTLNSAIAVVELVEELNTEHQGNAVDEASYVLQSDFGAHNMELFDRFADIAVSLRSDEGKSQGMRLLTQINGIAESERLARFDRLAPLCETIGSEQAKAKSIQSIAYAIRFLPLAVLNDRFTRYADVADSIQDADAKATAAAALTHITWQLPQDARRNAFDRLVSIARSIDDADAKKRIVLALRQASYALPPNERNVALASLSI